MLRIPKLMQMLLLIFLLASCGKTYRIEIDKKAGESQTVIRLEHQALRKYTGSDHLFIKVSFPEAFEAKGMVFTTTLRFPNEQSLWVKVPKSIGLEPSDIFFRGNQVTVWLTPTDLPQSEKRSYQSPRERRFDVVDHFAMIATMEKVTARLLGLIPTSFANCTAFPVGPSLVMTNHHCVANQDHCTNASFVFWDSRERNEENEVPARRFACKRIVATNANLDFSLLEVEGDPSEDYGMVRVLRSPQRLEPGTPVTILSQNPVGHKRSNGCVTGEYGNSFLIGEGKVKAKLVTNLICTSPVIGGDSGSPVFNNDGDLVGIVFATDKEISGMGYMSPVSAIFPKVPTEMAKASITWADR